MNVNSVKTTTYENEKRRHAAAEIQFQSPSLLIWVKYLCLSLLCFVENDNRHFDRSDASRREAEESIKNLSRAKPREQIFPPAFNQIIQPKLPIDNQPKS